MKRSATRRLREKMSCSTADAAPLDTPPAAVLTVSDSCACGEKKDLSGPAVEEALKRRGFQVVVRGLVADDSSTIQNRLIEMCRSARLVEYPRPPPTSGGSDARRRGSRRAPRAGP